MTQSNPRLQSEERRALRIVVVDDSPTTRAILCNILEKDPDICVVAQARDGREAVSLVTQLAPDLVTMDIEMPRMGGLDAIREIMSTRATPILVVASPSPAASSDLAFEAVAAGALDVFQKPARDQPGDYERQAESLRRRVRLLADVKVITRRRGARVQEPPPFPPPHGGGGGGCPGAERRIDVVAIGASTGGPQALVDVLRAIPEAFPACVLIVQHMAVDFVAGLGDWLSTAARSLTVKLASHGDVLRPGVAYLAPGDRHLRLDRKKRLVLNDGPHRHACRPSVDELMFSVAEHCGASALGVLLTGMGRDGAEGLLSMRKAGAMTIAQDQESCVVFGMPGAAVQLGAVDALLPLPEIGPRISEWVLASTSARDVPAASSG